MAHAITVRKNKQVEMAYVGETPWHGLGQKIDATASIDTWKIAAGMDWNIDRSVVNFNDIQGNSHEVPDQHVLHRSDNKQVLGLVSGKYKIVQPNDVLEFFRDLVDANGYTMHTAGTLFGGRRLWALAKIDDDAVILGKDKVGGYILLSTSCDGTLATTARPTTVRVVCNNTLSMATSEKSVDKVTVSHRSIFDDKKVKDKLGLARDEFKKFIESARLLANSSITEKQAEEFTVDLLRDTKTVFKEDITKTRQFLTIMNSYNGCGMGAELKGAKGTLWGLTNAVTEFIDHHARATSTDLKLDSAWFGRGDALKTLAFKRAIEMAS